MPEYNFQLRGWHAVVGVVALIAYMGVQTWLRVRPVEDGMRDAVRERLLNEYSGRGPKDLARIVAESRAGLPVEELPPPVQRNVEFSSMAAHGRIGGSVTFLRAEVTVDGGEPPDGRATRYFSVSRKFDGGWMVVGESSSYLYYRALFP